MIRQIKEALRGMMNGTVSASMRAKGLNYRMNFGVELPRLRAYAEMLPHTYELASALWKEDIRECRLLAGMLMPTEGFDGELAEIWIEQMRFPEEAECTVMNLFCHLPEASEKAFEWIADERPMFQLCGFLLWGRLFMLGAEPTERDQSEFLDQTAAALQSGHQEVKSAAGKALQKFMNLGLKQEAAGERLLKTL